MSISRHPLCRAASSEASVCSSESLATPSPSTGMVTWSLRAMWGIGFELSPPRADSVVCTANEVVIFSTYTICYFAISSYVSSNLQCRWSRLYRGISESYRKPRVTTLNLLGFDSK